jgi:hypothetical protein
VTLKDLATGQFEELRFWSSEKEFCIPCQPSKPIKSFPLSSVISLAVKVRQNDEGQFSAFGNRSGVMRGGKQGEKVVSQTQAIQSIADSF